MCDNDYELDDHNICHPTQHSLRVKGYAVISHAGSTEISQDNVGKMATHNPPFYEEFYHLKKHSYPNRVLNAPRAP